MLQDSRGSGRIKPVSQKLQDQANTTRCSLKAIQRRELTLRHRCTTGLALPTTDGVGLATNPTRDHRMDGLDGTTEIGARGILARNAFRTQPLLSSATASP